MIPGEPTGQARCPVGPRGLRRRGRRWWGGFAGWSRSIRGGMRRICLRQTGSIRTGATGRICSRSRSRISSAYRAVAGAGGQGRRSAVSHHRRSEDRQGRRRGDVHAHRSGQRRDRGRQHQLLAAAAAHAGRHRGHVPDDGARVRRARLPALRVEMRCAQCAVAGGGAAAGLPVRGAVPAGGDLQGPQPRHDLVLHHRQRVAAIEAGLSSSGWRRKISMARGSSGGRWPISSRRPDRTSTLAAVRPRLQSQAATRCLRNRSSKRVSLRHRQRALSGRGRRRRWVCRSTAVLPARGPLAGS